MSNPIDRLTEQMIKTILKGKVSELPIRTQAELLMLPSDSVAARIGCIGPSSQPATILITVCVVVKPYLWNGFHTRQMNLSREMEKVEIFDNCNEITLSVPRLLHSLDDFQ